MKNHCSNCRFMSQKIGGEYCMKTMDAHLPKHRCAFHRGDNWLWALVANTCGASGRWFEAKFDTLADKVN